MFGICYYSKLENYFDLILMLCIFQKKKRLTLMQRKLNQNFLIFSSVFELFLTYIIVSWRLFKTFYLDTKLRITPNLSKYNFIKSLNRFLI